MRRALFFHGIVPECDVSLIMNLVFLGRSSNSTLPLVGKSLPAVSRPLEFITVTYLIFLKI